MSETTRVASDLIDAINQAQTAIMAPGVVTASGAGKAYQMVAQASALAIQDAVDSLRNAGTLTDAAVAAALSQLTATGDARYLEIIKALEPMRADAIAAFAARTEVAIETLKNFPSS